MLAILPPPVTPAPIRCPPAPLESDVALHGLLTRWSPVAQLSPTNVGPSDWEAFDPAVLGLRMQSCSTVLVRLPVALLYAVSRPFDDIAVAVQHLCATRDDDVAAKVSDSQRGATPVVDDSVLSCWQH